MKEMIWVIKDQYGNFVRRDCFKKIDGELLYVSYRTFSEECRGFVDFKACNDVLKALKIKNGEIGCSIVFKALEVDLDEVILIHKDFVSNGKDENMVIVDIEIELDL